MLISQESKDKDRDTYLLVFSNNPPYCEECGVRLPNQFEDESGNIIMISQYSHIISKGSDPKFRHDYRNFNRLCFDCHQKWEFGDRQSMNIYENNVNIANMLRNE